MSEKIKEKKEKRKKENKPKKKPEKLLVETGLEPVTPGA